MTANPPLMHATPASLLARIPSPVIDPSFDAQINDLAECQTRPTSALRNVARLLLLAHESGEIDDAALAPINTGRAGITHACDLAGAVMAEITGNAARRAGALVADAGLDATNEDARVCVALDHDNTAIALSNAEVVRGILIASLTDVQADSDTHADLVATAALRATLALTDLGPMVDSVTHARMDCDMGLMHVLCEDFGHWFDLVEDWLLGGRPDEAEQAWAELCAADMCDTDYEGARADFDELWAKITTPSVVEARFRQILENQEATTAGLTASTEALEARDLAPGVACYLRGLIALADALAPLRATAADMEVELREGPLFMFAVIADQLDLSFTHDQHEMAMQAGGDMVVLLDLTAPDTTLAGIEDALTLCYAQVLAFEAMANHGFDTNMTPETTDDQ